MLSFEDFEEKTISRQEIFKGSVIEVVVDDVRLPDGSTAKRELVFHPGAVAIIPITAENKMVLVKQFRKPLEKATLEIPAGKIDPGEENYPKETALRELEEETAYQAELLEPVAAMYVTPGFANELLHIFYAENLKKAENPLPQDEDEVIELYELTLEQTKQEIANGMICDAKTLFAVQYWELMEMRKALKEV
ncbi:NUDIX hydrolase [Enterococcus sp. BWB1-3]|uniref:NUDIX hydrolase n=1 Tax=unclassified Enterococcus TaxID=2608891 RepID=UPI0019229BD3|nr:MULTISPECIES: NUDIX hydrolase [unclassified Enterococcus]MBL1230923.1 NUDIX hydrolase [Enterococcus sp. BWB1-3]MCB5952988.1 NUDIX hydrolase [Enterococcus sp. BWT-B8]MCB5956251.1 NUDIX hydrolase [Enterococcus sp. CWB-B31]